MANRSATQILPRYIFRLTDDVTVAKMRPVRNHHDQYVEHDDLLRNLLGFCNYVTYVILKSYAK